MVLLLNPSGVLLLNSSGVIQEDMINSVNKNVIGSVPMQSQDEQMGGMVKRLNKINSQKEVANFGEISVNAARWESCEWETSFPDWVGYQYKTYYGQKANWVGRLANTEDERSGIMPCDFSFYLNGYRVNKVDGWSIATECAVRWDNGISVRRYGYSNQKMIIGHGRLTACGVWSFNTEMLRDQIRFYS